MSSMEKIQSSDGKQAKPYGSYYREKMGEEKWSALDKYTRTMLESEDREAEMLDRMVAERKARQSADSTPQ